MKTDQSLVPGYPKGKKPNKSILISVHLGAGSMSDDPEQHLQLEASPKSDLPATQTPLLGRFLGAGALSPAISLRNFGRARGTPRTSHPLCLRTESGGEEAASRIEEAAESGVEALEP